MKLFICHESALEYWRQRRALPENSADRRCRVVLPKGATPVASLALSGLEVPVHILLARPGNRRKPTIETQHVYSGETPIGSFMNVGEDFGVSSPEFCFLQMAERLTLIELVELGYELCGVYSLPLLGDKNVPKKGFYNRQALTSAKKLEAFLESTKGARGHKKAERALRYLLDGSASPMETKLAIFLTLPYKLGGFGFSPPKLNRQVKLVKSARKYFKKDYYVCDLFWPETKTAVEYDSDFCHTGSERIADDSNRRSALNLMGVNVVSVTRQQLFSPVGFEGVVRVISKHLEKRLRFEENSFAAEHRKLRNQLLSVYYETPTFLIP
ncbi:MAG: endonuclease domain-containing protein [Coriobacteriia bacterium]|nr:endonuclease domain-containing protein [Coriobacteriia bacterium]